MTQRKSLKKTVDDRMPQRLVNKKNANGLTPAQEAFCLAVVETNNQAEAYRRAYPKSLKWKPEVVAVNSSKLMSNANISLRVEELRTQVAKKAEVTAIELIESNRRIRENSMRIDPATGNMVNPVAALKANELNAKIAGLFRDQINVQQVIVFRGGIDSLLNEKPSESPEVIDAGR